MENRASCSGVKRWGGTAGFLLKVLVFADTSRACLYCVSKKKKEKKGEDRKSTSYVQRVRNFSAAARRNSRLRQRVLSSRLAFPMSSFLAPYCMEHPGLQTLSNIPLPAVPQPVGDDTNKFSFISLVLAVLGSWVCNPM